MKLLLRAQACVHHARTHSHACGLALMSPAQTLPREANHDGATPRDGPVVLVRAKGLVKLEEPVVFESKHVEPDRVGVVVHAPLDAHIPGEFVELSLQQPARRDLQPLADLSTDDCHVHDIARIRQVKHRGQALKARHGLSTHERALALIDRHVAMECVHLALAAKAAHGVQNYSLQALTLDPFSKGATQILYPDWLYVIRPIPLVQHDAPLAPIAQQHTLPDAHQPIDTLGHAL